MSIYTTPREPRTPHWEVAPTSAHNATVFFLHGLGGSGEGWLWVVNELAKREGLKGVKWVLPNAPRREITANFGQEMPGWYNVQRISSDSVPPPADEQGLFESVGRVHKLLDTEIEQAKVPSERVVLAGFSQGAAVTMAAGLTYGKRLAGLAALSGYLMCAERVEKEKSEHIPKVPLFLAHGKDDGVVSIERSERSVQTLKDKFGYKLVGEGDQEGTLTVKYYDDLGHFAGDDEVVDLGDWLEGVLSA